MAKMHWKRQKLLAILNFRREFRVAFIPPFTIGKEIQMENGIDYLADEVRVDPNNSNIPTHISTEQG